MEQIVFLMLSSVASLRNQAFLSATNGIDVHAHDLKQELFLGPLHTYGFVRARL